MTVVPEDQSADWLGRVSDDAAALQKQQDDPLATGRPQLRQEARSLLADLVRPHRRAHRRGPG